MKKKEELEAKKKRKYYAEAASKRSMIANGKRYTEIHFEVEDFSKSFLKAIKDTSKQYLMGTNQTKRANDQLHQSEVHV